MTLVACYVAFCLLCCVGLLELVRRDRCRAERVDDGSRAEAGEGIPGRARSSQPAR